MVWQSSTQEVILVSKSIGAYTMSNCIEIQNLSKEEKLRVMEAIWEDLSKDDDQIESPDWHLQALQETDQRLRSGQENMIDWHDAKKELRKRFEWKSSCFLRHWKICMMAGCFTRSREKDWESISIILSFPTSTPWLCTLEFIPSFSDITECCPKGSHMPFITKQKKNLWLWSGEFLICDVIQRKYDRHWNPSEPGNPPDADSFKVFPSIWAAQVRFPLYETYR